MKKLITFLGLCFFSLASAQGTIQINNFTSYTLKFQLVTELDASCDFNLAGWNTTHPPFHEYIFDLPPGNSVTYTSYFDTGIQIPSMDKFKRSDTGSLYPLSVAQALYGSTSHWAFSKFDLVNSGGTSVMSSTIGVPSNCNPYSYYYTNGTLYAEFFTLGGTTYFNVY